MQAASLFIISVSLYILRLSIQSLSPNIVSVSLYFQCLFKQLASLYVVSVSYSCHNCKRLLQGCYLYLNPFLLSISLHYSLSQFSLTQVPKLSYKSLRDVSIKLRQQHFQRLWYRFPQRGGSLEGVMICVVYN